jgi:hypothetical protein
MVSTLSEPDVPAEHGGSADVGRVVQQRRHGFRNADRAVVRHGHGRRALGVPARLEAGTSHVLYNWPGVIMTILAICAYFSEKKLALYR